MSDDLQQPIIHEFRPRTGSQDAWNAAYIRVEDYLRAHRIHNRLHQGQIIHRVLARAAERHEQNPAQDPTVLAAEEIETLMDNWFGEVLDEKGLPHERIATAGRVALLLSDGPHKWPYAFLDEAHIPPDFAKAMRDSSITAGPDLAISNMGPRPIDLGTISEAAGDTLDRFEQWPILKTLFLWGLFSGILFLIFVGTR